MARGAARRRRRAPRHRHRPPRPRKKILCHHCGKKLHPTRVSAHERCMGDLRSLALSVPIPDDFPHHRTRRIRRPLFRPMTPVPFPDLSSPPPHLPPLSPLHPGELEEFGLDLAGLDLDDDIPPFPPPSQTPPNSPSNPTDLSDAPDSRMSTGSDAGSEESSSNSSDSSRSSRDEDSESTSSGTGTTTIRSFLTGHSDGVQDHHGHHFGAIAYQPGNPIRRAWDLQTARNCEWSELKCMMCSLTVF